MQHNSCSIGRVLAHINFDDRNNGSSGIAGSYSGEPEFHNIKSRYIQLNSTPDLPLEIIRTIPQRCCFSDDAFLDKNADFFIAYYILSETGKINIATEGRLVKHLNDCYWCFITFNQFIRDYHLTLLQLQGGNK
ncbi:MAG TPA: hypothetical protein PLP19_18530 [bacterium]|nr:hypothetical protein [bacterium]HPN45495.1 hypothetical protein [bacterium]